MLWIQRIYYPKNLLLVQGSKNTSVKSEQAYQARSGQCAMVGQHCGGDKLMNLCITQQTIHLENKTITIYFKSTVNTFKNQSIFIFMVNNVTVTQND